jgi:putative FmdB family regulatory protein
MPIYEYYCSHCRRVFEDLRPIAERDAPASCPSCSSPSQERQLSTFAAHASSGATWKSSPSGATSCELPSCCGGSCSLN